MKPKSSGKLFEFDNVFEYGLSEFGRLRLFQAGELQCEPNFVVNEHFQYCYEISYILDGEGTFYSDDNATEVKTNDFYVTPINTNHSIASSQEKPLRFMYLGFDFIETGFDELKELKDFYSTKIPLCFSDLSDTRIVFYKMLQEVFSKISGNRIMIEAYLMQIMTLCMRSYKMKNTPNYPYKDIQLDSSDEMIYAIYRYIDSNIYSKMSVKEISEHLGYHPNYVSRIFSENVDCTLQQFIANQKANKAIEFFENEGSNVSMIANRLGYANVQSFSKMFKRVKGITPSQYLENI